MHKLRPCSFRGYINPTHSHPLSPTPSPLFPLLPTLKQKYHSFPLSPTPSPPFPHSFIQLPSSFNSFQLLPTFTHSFPPFSTLKKNTTFINSHSFLSLLSHTHTSHTPNFPLKRTWPKLGYEKERVNMHVWPRVIPHGRGTLCILLTWTSNMAMLLLFNFLVIFTTTTEQRIINWSTRHIKTYQTYL